MRRARFFILGRVGPRGANNNELKTSFRPLPRRRLELTNIHPEVTGAMTRYDFSNLDVYVKRPRYLKWLAFVRLEDLLTSERVAKITLREIHSAEVLARNPHKNLVKYLGVEIRNVVRQSGFGVLGTMPYHAVTGLVFERHEIDLFDMVASKQPIDVDKVISDITAGLEHIHSLSMVHCDIKPENIFHKAGRFAIGDFDSVHIIHNPYRGKIGTPGWANTTWKAAKYEHDWYCLEKVKQWLINRIAAYQSSE